MQTLRCLLPFLVAAGCGSDALDSGASSDNSDSPSPGCFSNNECPTGQFCNEFGECEASGAAHDGGPGEPPEVEIDFGAPSSALRFLYVAMPDLDALARIDGRSLEVQSVAVGDRPGALVALPGRDDALVLDRGSATATLVRPAEGSNDKTVLATLPRVNRVSLSPTGDFAVAWFDFDVALAEAGSLAGVGEIGSFQDVTVLCLKKNEESSADLAVGFRPRAVEFDAAGTRAFVITEEGVSVIDLAEAATGELHVAASIPVAAEDADPARTEVHVTPDGVWALTRDEGHPELRITRVDAGRLGATTTTIALPSEATDVDLAADGATAWAVLRETSQLAVIHLADASSEIIDLDGKNVGSAVIDEVNQLALLFTNAFYEEELVVVDLAAASLARWPLQKAVQAVAVAPDGRTALVIHAKKPGDPASASDVEELVDLSEGYSLVDLGSGFAKLVLTPVAPGPFAYAPDGRHAYLALDGGDAEGAVARLQIIDLETFVADDLDLGSPPETVGILPTAGVAFVSQRHDLGRVTFVDFETGAARGVTGFQLGSHIVD